MKIELEKYHSLGNDYLIYDPRINQLELTTDLVKKICHRNYGAGADGILYGPFLKDNKISLTIYNPDGSEAMISGNGVRIFARYLIDSEFTDQKKFSILTKSGDYAVEVLDEFNQIFRICMGKASFYSDDIPVIGDKREVIKEEMDFDEKKWKVTCVSTGNPHCVIPMEDISKEKIIKIAPMIESNYRFPERINVLFLKVIDRNKIAIEVYERGAGYTLASGTSCCAAVSAALRLGLVDKIVTVVMPGGKSRIEIQEDGSIYMTGPVKQVGSIILFPEFM